MRPLRYSINVTLDGCCDHREGISDEELHRHAAENIDQADALLFGRVTYEMMEQAWRPATKTGLMPDWMEPWMKPFARTIDAKKKYVVAGHGPTLFAGLSKGLDLKLVSRTELGSGVVVLRYEPRRQAGAR